MLSIGLIIIFVLGSVLGGSDVYKTDADILEDATLDTDTILESTILVEFATLHQITASNTPQFSLIKKYGYPCEIHHVTTEDGYVLELHRVPHGPGANGTAGRPAVLLQHGLLSSSAEWVLMRPGKGLAYILADRGYDVWMGNARGNTYSRNHRTNKPSTNAFWKFSWHEIGYYDLPAMIDYALKETGQSKLSYVGFSQGTTVFWVMTSSRPEYNDKVVQMHALAPVAFVGNIRSLLIRAIAPFTDSLEAVMRLLGFGEFLPNGKLNEIAGQRMCLEEAATQLLCTNILFLLCGYNSEQLNKTMLPIVMGHTPAGASSRQLVHFGQLYNSKQFRQFDHGILRNKIVYGTYRPPKYDLDKIKIPIFLHYADNDWLSTPKDVDKLSKSLKSVIGKFRIPLSKFNHLDFVFANDAKTLVYDRLLNIMKRW